MPGGGGSIASSNSNSFSSLVPNLTISLGATSTTPITLTVANDSSNVVSAVQSFVSDYNTVMSAIATDTTYDTSTSTAAVLQGDGNLLSVQSQLSALVTQQFSGVGSFSSLAALGITLGQDGTMSLNTSTLQNAFSQSSTDLQNFFTTATSGVAAQFNNVINQLAGPTNSLLGNEVTSLATQTTDNTDRINQLNAQLALESTRLTDEFDQMELTISGLQANQSALSSIQPFYDLSSGSSSSSLNSSSTSSTNLSNTSSNEASGFS